MRLRYTMRWVNLLLCLAMMACQGEDAEVVTSADSGTKAAEGIQLAFATSNVYQAQTRMSRENTQADGQYREIDYVRFIPFDVERDIKSSDASLKSIVRYYISDKFQQFTENVTYPEVGYSYDKLDVSRTLFTVLGVPSGTQSFLIYAHPEGGGVDDTSANKFAMGSLVPSAALEELDIITAGSITFSPDKIYKTGSSDQITYDGTLETAEDEIVEYLNYLAQTPYTPVGSSTSICWYQAPANSFAYDLFQKFIHQGLTFTLGNNQLPKLLTDIYHQMQEKETELTGSELASLVSLMAEFFNRADGNQEDNPYHDKIQYNGTAFTALNTWADFPLTASLPDGMFVFKWISDESVNQFALLSSANTFLDVKSMEQNEWNGLKVILKPRILDKQLLAYPAQLWYFDNSTLHTRELEFSSDELQQILSATPWSEIDFDGFSNDNTVHSETKSAIVDKTINYGVARLEVNAKLRNAPLVYTQPGGAQYSIPSDAIQFKGIMVTHQHTAGFDFQPIDYDFNVIYDNKILNNRNPGRPFTLTTNILDRNKVNILTLPSQLNEEVYIIAEFCILADNLPEAMRDKPFRNANCEIYPNTCFYMVAKLDPREGNINLNDNPKQVFISDKVTKVQLNLTSLDGAYNYVPDVRTPALTLGLDVITDWQQAEPNSIWME